MEIITSKDNIRIKNAKKLYKKRNRTTSYLIEGAHLYEEAVKSGATIRQVFVTEKFSDIASATLVSEEVMKFLSDVAAPQGIIAEVSFSNDNQRPENLAKLLILENVQDPGNVGTMIRTADAADFDGVVLLAGCADAYSPKVLRTMQGSHFHLPIFQEKDTQSFYMRLKNQRVSVIATTLSNQAIDYRNLAKPEKFALVLGNEGEGITEETSRLADILIYISMPGQAESLNVAVAAGIMMFSLTA
jgi:TrmH family RNA methyltransferase